MMSLLRAAAAGIVLGALAFAPAMAQQGAPAGIQKVTTAKGDVWADAKGMTLYTYARDTEANKSTCVGGCATNWPPLMATAADKAAGDWTIADRPDGSKMWAYKGKPVYLWINDKAKGDTTGDGVGGNWALAKP